MNAVDVSGTAPGGQRIQLAERLPLEAPMLLQFFPIYACNFKCSYCTFSVPRSERGFISDVVSMDMRLFEKCIDDLASFPSKISVIRFVGMGEPLLHKQIAEMVRYAKASRMAERVEILTNASLLTPPMTDRLLQAGLTRLIVSLQGVTKEKYSRVGGVTLDFEQFVANLRYFYQQKGETRLHMKVIDLALDDENERQQFYATFGDICDTIGVEVAGPIFPGVDYSKVLGDIAPAVTQFGRDKLEATVCPQPFFTMQVNPDGKVVPCYSVSYPEIMGNAAEESLESIWRGTRFTRFRRRMLDGRSCASETCGTCNIIRHRFQPEDRLDHDLPRLRSVFSESLA